MPYLVLVLSALFSYYMIPGLYAQVPKYLIIQFKVDQAMSSILTGQCKNQQCQQIVKVSNERPKLTSCCSPEIFE